MSRLGGLAEGSSLASNILFAGLRKAFALLTHGYAGVRQRLDARLAALEATIAAASVNRVDVACDLDVPGFEPDPASIIAPARTHARSYHPGEGARAAEVTVHRLARRVNGIMPGRQLCLYDKRADSLAKRKLYWPEVSGLDLEAHRDPIWRAEVRAGRDELARHLPQRSFAAVEAALGDIVAAILGKIRYVVPSPTDLNPGRWPNHPVWEAAGGHLRAAIEAGGFDPAPPRRDLRTPRAIKLDMLGRQLVGLSQSFAALAGLDQAEDLPDLVASLLREDWRQRPEEAERGLVRARARHGVLD